MKPVWPIVPSSVAMCRSRSGGTRASRSGETGDGVGTHQQRHGRESIEVFPRKEGEWNQAHAAGHEQEVCGGGGEGTPERAEDAELIAGFCLLETDCPGADYVVVDFEPAGVTVDTKKAERSSEIGRPRVVGQDLDELGRVGGTGYDVGFEAHHVETLRDNLVHQNGRRVRLKIGNHDVQGSASTSGKVKDTERSTHTLRGFPSSVPGL